MADGLQRAGEWRQALDYCLKLVDLEDAKPGLEKVEDLHLARRDCWVQARLAALRSASQGTGNPGAEAAAEIDRVVKQRLEEVLKDPNVDRLKKFLAFFGNQPQAPPARTELLKRLAAASGTMEAEMFMAAAVPARTGDTGADRKAQAALLAEMAELNFRARRVDDAAACFRQLQREFSDVPCHATRDPKVGTPVPQTSAEWLAAFPDGDELRRKVDLSASAWPVGEVEVKKPDATNRNRVVNRPPRYDMQLGGAGLNGMGPLVGGGPFFADYTVGMEVNQQEITLCDGLGNTQRPIRLAVNQNGRAYGYGIGYNPNSTLARSCGHLLVVSTGTKIVALDPWSASSAASAASHSTGNPVPGRSAQILWSHDLIDTTTDGNGNMIFINNGMDREWRANPFGPVNARYVSFLRKRSIVVVDPLTGDALVDAAGYSARQRGLRRRTVSVRAAAEQRRGVGLSGDRRPTAGNAQGAQAQFQRERRQPAREQFCADQCGS